MSRFIEIIDTSFIPEEIRCKLAIKIRLDGGECWIWQGYLNEDGYGIVRYKGRRWRVHILIRYLLTNEEIKYPEFEHDHLCCNRACGNPECIKIVPRDLNQKFLKNVK